MIKYWANAVALNEIGKPDRLFTYGSVGSVNECEAIFRGWENGHGYKLLVSWIQAEDEDGRTNIIHLTEYRKNFMC